jgi:hypothetical protein
LSGRTDEIMRTVNRVNSELIDQLTSMTAADLQTPCDDPSAATVGAVVAHLREGAPEVFGWLAGIADGSVAAAPAKTGHVHGHSPQPVRSDPAGLMEMVRAGRPVLAGLLSGLTDKQLDSCPPAADGITDGTRTLFEVIMDMADHQAQHLSYLRKALASPAASRPALDAR